MSNTTIETNIVNIPSPGLKAEETPQVSERMNFEGDVPADTEVLQVTSLGSDLTLEREYKGDFNHRAARSLLELPEFVVEGSYVDRSLKDDHVTYLLNCMKRGTFHSEFVQIITCICEEVIGNNAHGTEYRMNGQHTAWAREYMDADYHCPVRFLRYRAKTVTDMRNLYASIDRGSPRGRSQVINSMLAGSPGFEGVNEKLLKSLASGLNMWLSPPVGKSVNRVPQKVRLDIDALVYQMQTTYSELTQKVKTYLLKRIEKDKKTAQRLLRTAVVAAIYETMQKLPSKMHEFWDIVCDGVGADSTEDPRHRLFNYLIELRISSSGHRAGSQLHRASGTRSAAPEDVYAWCVNAWNAWRAGQTVKALRGFTGKRTKAK